MEDKRLIEKDRKKPPIMKRWSLSSRLGYLNSAHCPNCRTHLFSYYDKDLERSFCLSEDSNYCRNCGQHLDLDRYKKSEIDGKIMLKPQMMI